MVFKCPFKHKPWNDCMNMHLQLRKHLQLHKKAQAAGPESWFFPLPSSHKSSPGVLHPALESSVQKRCGFVGLDPEDGHKSDQREERLKELGLFNLEKRKLWEDHTLNISGGILKKMETFTWAYSGRQGVMTSNWFSELQVHFQMERFFNKVAETLE